MNVVFGHWRWRRFLLSVYQPLIIFIAPRVKIIFHSARYCVNRNHKRHVGFVTEHTNLLQVINNTLLRWALTPERQKSYNQPFHRYRTRLIAEKVSLMSANVIKKIHTTHSSSSLRGENTWPAMTRKEIAQT